MRALRFGISAPGTADGAAWAALARDVERRGFSTLLTADHLRESLEPFSALAAAAAATSTLHVGTFVLNNDFRHPVLVARESLTIDALSGGRFELGLGAGHMQSEYDEVGLRFDDGNTRVSRLEEAVAIIEPLLRGDAVEFAGSHYRVRGHRAFPVPTTARRLPLLIGGNGQRVHALAARSADAVGFVGFTHHDGGRRVDLSSFTPEALDGQVARVKEIAGSRVDELEFNALLQQVVITDDPEGVVAAMAERTGVAPAQLLQSPYLLVGPVEQLADALLERRERFGITYWVAFVGFLDAMTEVMDAVSKRM
jgi:probable F420-dependent oxidoreductase